MGRPRTLDHDAILAALDAGEKAAAIAARFGCSVAYPHKIRAQYRGRLTERRSQLTLDILAALKAGERPAAISRRLGCQRTTPYVVAGRYLEARA